MLIKVKRNIDNYKPDVFHGLDFSQTMHALGTVISGAAAFLFANFYLHLPQTICFYIAMPFALPVAIAGFYKIDGMSPAAYLRKRREIRRMPVYFYVPEPLSDFFLEEEEPLDQSKEKAKEEEVFLGDIYEDKPGEGDKDWMDACNS